MQDIKLICFDLDDTLITNSSWKRLNLGLGVTIEEDRQMYLDYKAGLFSYDVWNDKVLEYYVRHSDSTREGITKILSQYQYNAGARDVIDYLKERGYIIVLISGSIDIMVDMIARDLGIKYFKANNDFVFDDENKLISINSGGNDTLAKLRHLESFCDLLGISIKNCVCIGDGENDLELFKKTGHGITFKGKKIEKYAWKVIDTLSGLKEIL